ncbi:MAG: hypothetical protein HYZ42_00320 [Bacteroidetes bacterium]|nr:hypothetical protein [Bacteroidota bacterium]
MTVTIEIPNQIYRKLEQIAKHDAEPTSEVVEKFIAEKIRDTFEEWWKERFIKGASAKEAIDILRESGGSAPPDEHDRW